jgi:hypothetical protein
MDSSNLSSQQPHSFGLLMEEMMGEITLNGGQVAW